MRLPPLATTDMSKRPPTPPRSPRSPWWCAAPLLALGGPTLAAPAYAQEAAAAAVQGQVRSAAGEPIGRATIELLDGAGTAVRSGTTDDAGRYRLAAPAPGRYRLRAARLGYRVRTADVNLTAGGTVRADVTLEAVAQSLSTVVTSATRSGQQLGNVPAAISVVSQDVIQATGRRNTNLEEALRTVPGLVIRDQLGGASRVTIAIRGAGSSNAFGVRSIRLLIDGIPKNNAGGSGQDLANLDMASVQSIEVLRGPASTLYGNQAGGVVAVTTEVGGETPRRQLQVLGGSYGFQRAHGKATGQAFGGTVSYLASAWRTQQEGYRANSNFDQTGFSSKLVYRPDQRSTITGVMSYDNLGQDVSGALTEQEFRTRPRLADSTGFLSLNGQRLNNFGRLDEFRFGVNVQRTLGEKEQVETQVFYVPRSTRSPSQAQFIQQNFINRGATARLLSTRALGPLGNRFTTGVDFQDTPIQTATTGRAGTTSAGRSFSVFDEQATTVGVYALDELALHRDVTLTAGVRRDNIRFRQQNQLLTLTTRARTFTRVTPKVGLTYRPTASLSTFANFSESFEAPVIGQLRNSPAPSGEFVTNQVVRPLTVRTFEVGTRGAAGRASFEVTAFRQTLRDQPVNVSFARPAPATGQFQALVNAAAVRQSGIETGAQFALTGALTLAGTYTYSDFAYDRYAAGTTNFTGKALPGIPKHNGFAELRYRDARGLTGGVEVQSVGEFFLNDANTATNPAYRVVNLRLGWERAVGSTRVAPFVAVNNLFSEEYSSQPQINAALGRYYNPLPGANYSAGLRVNW
jgi:iron complex outermembrane receptor protein